MPKLPLPFALNRSPIARQYSVLQNLLRAAKDTSFGRAYDFQKILTHFSRYSFQETDLLTALQKHYAQQVPFHSYEQMYTSWWRKVYEEGEENVCWAGKTRYFSLSSGTSSGRSKRLPLSDTMMYHMRWMSLKQWMSLLLCPSFLRIFPSTTMVVLMGNSQGVQGRCEGDISSLLARKCPSFLRFFIQLSHQTSSFSWNDKLEEIVSRAPSIRVSTIIGTTSWIQVLLSRVMERYGVRTIHDIWPDLRFCIHGGVPLEPYRHFFDRITAFPLHFLDVYLASEGFIAYQQAFSDTAMTLAWDAGIFYEFVPFDEHHVDAQGRILPTAKSMGLEKVEIGKPYALIISTCSGAWRYILNDVISFTALEPVPKLRIVGRCQDMMSVCGEHLSLSNMDCAVAKMSARMNFCVKEYTLMAMDKGGFFTHIWYMGVQEEDIASLCEKRAAHCLDEELLALNMDYATLRKTILSPPQVVFVEAAYFYVWMRKHIGWGAQKKFPRILKGKRACSWGQLLKEKQVLS